MALHDIQSKRSSSSRLCLSVNANETLENHTSTVHIDVMRILAKSATVRYTRKSCKDANTIFI